MLLIDDVYKIFVILTILNSFDGVDSKFGTLVTTAKSNGNLCRFAVKQLPNILCTQ